MAGDSKWLVVLSGASTLGVFGYLNAGDVVKGHGNLISVIFGALGMILFTKYLNQKFPKIKDIALVLQCSLEWSGQPCTIYFLNKNRQFVS